MTGKTAQPALSLFLTDTHDSIRVNRIMQAARTDVDSGRHEWAPAMGMRKRKRKRKREAECVCNLVIHDDGDDEVRGEMS